MNNESEDHKLLDEKVVISSWEREENCGNCKLYPCKKHNYDFNLECISCEDHIKIYGLEQFYFRHKKLIRFYLRLCIGICLFTSIEILLLLWDLDYLYFIWENLYRWINPRIRDLITTFSFTLFQLLTVYIFGLFIWENKQND